jgi:hypothetical protein
MVHLVYAITSCRRPRSRETSKAVSANFLEKAVFDGTDGTLGTFLPDWFKYLKARMKRKEPLFPND